MAWWPAQPNESSGNEPGGAIEERAGYRQAKCPGGREAQSLRRELDVLRVHAGDVAARAGQARDDAAQATGSTSMKSMTSAAPAAIRSFLRPATCMAVPIAQARPDGLEVDVDDVLDVAPHSRPAIAMATGMRVLAQRRRARSGRAPPAPPWSARAGRGGRRRTGPRPQDRSRGRAAPRSSARGSATASAARYAASPVPSSSSTSRSDALLAERKIAAPVHRAA